MSLFVLQCKDREGGGIMRSLRRRLSLDVLDEVFVYRSERLWRSEGEWKIVEKELFPGYLFLESHCPEVLSGELERYREFLKIMEETGYLISLYEEEEAYLKFLCRENHCLRLSYGYKKDGISYITRGPLTEMEDRIVRVDWHRRYALLQLSLAGRKTQVWAGLEIDREAAAVDCCDGASSAAGLNPLAS